MKPLTIYTFQLFLYLAGFCFIRLIPLHAQPDPVVFERLAGDLYGVPEIDVQDVLQDSDGFFWIATYKGLIRYDGHEMSVFRENPADTNSLSDNRLRILAEDHEGYLWIGTASHGLLRYDRKKEIFTRFLHDPTNPAGISDNSIRAILVDAQQRLWVGTVNGLNRFDRRTGTFIRYPQAGKGERLLNSCYVRHRGLAEDQFGRIWISTWDDGMICLDPESGETTSVTMHGQRDADDDGARFTRIISGTDGFLWAAGTDTRIHRIDPRNFEMLSYDYGLSKEQDENAANLSDLQPMADGSLWLATFGRGLIHFWPDTGRARSFRHDIALPSSIGSDMVNALWLDQSGYLWAGHRGPGLSRLFTQPSGFHSKHRYYTNPQAALVDRQGNTWLGTWEDGLYFYNATTGQTIHHLYQESATGGLANNIVWDILEDRAGYIWLATHKGLQRVDPRGKHHFTTFGKEAGIPRPSIRSIALMKNDQIAIGTMGGLCWYDPYTGLIEVDTTLPNNLDHDFTKIFEDSQGNLWAAVLNKGVFMRDQQSGNWFHFVKKSNDPGSITANSVRGIVEDDKQQIWLGTRGGGLNKFLPHPTALDSSQFQHWRPYNSDLPDENIHNLSIDQHQKLWLSTDLGLYSFDTKTQRIRPYTLPGTIKGLNVLTRPGANGHLYVGNSQQLYRFHPDSLWQNDQQPPVFITGLEINDRPVPVRHTFGDTLELPSPLEESILYTTELKLKYRQNNLTFNFTALNYIQPQHNRYAYFLEGVDRDTLFTDASRRYARYPNLSPGTYTFRVFAADNEENWNWEGKAITIHIQPPWWRTTVAYFLWGALLLSLIYSLYRFLLNRRLEKAEHLRLAEMDALKTRLYTNITHEFRTPLTVILGLSDQIKNQVSESVKNNLQIIRRNGRQLLDLVNQLLDLSKLEAGRLELEYQQGDLINYLKYLLESFHSLAETKQIRLHFISDLQTFHLDFDPVRLTHVLANLLSNAIKFSPHGRDVYVTVSSVRSPEFAEQIAIRIRDTGTGIPAEKLPFIFDRFYQVDNSTTRSGEGTGIGLTLSQELVRLMGGEILVTSELGKGSEFTVILPVRRQYPVGTVADNPELPVFTPVTSELALVPPVPKAYKPTLLIVEDNPDLVKYLVNALNPAYNLEVAYNGQQGIDKAVERIPDLIIADVMMPEKDGFELCRDLRRHPLTSHVPVIILTAKADLASRLTGLQRGADAYLSKPFIEEELLVRIEALLTQRQKLQAYYRSRAGVSEEVPAVIPAEAESSEENAFLKTVNELLEQNLANEHFSVEQLARELFVDPSNLFRKIRALTGLNPTQYLRAYRLAKAKKLLWTTELSIAAVALECGFAHHNYFSRMFKRETGLSPSKYRKNRPS